jgi:hypothetical protein
VKALAPLTVAAAILAASAAAASKPTFEFGRIGGNVRPLQIKVTATGRVTANGQTTRLLTQAKVRQLLGVVRAQRFFSLPKRIACGSTLPDFATLYVTVRDRGRAHSVSARGSCNTRFTRVWAALAKATGAGTS